MTTIQPPRPAVPQFGGRKTTVRRNLLLLPALLLGAAAPANTPAAAKDVFVKSAQSVAPVTMEQAESVRQQFYRLLDDYMKDWNGYRLNPARLAEYEQQLEKLDAGQLEKEDRAYRMLFLNDVKWRLLADKHRDTVGQIRLGTPEHPVEQMLQEAARLDERTEAGQPVGVVAGKDLYDGILNHRGFVNLTAEELARVATEDFNRIKGQMDAMAKVINPKATDWREVYEEIRKHHPEKDQVLDAYREEAKRAEKFIRDNNLMTIPQGYTLRIVETPRMWRSQIPFAAYVPSTMTFWVTVTMTDTDDPEELEKQLRNNNYAEIGPVTVHEAMPGHHLDNLHKREARDPLDPGDPRTEGRQFLLRSGNWASSFYTEGWGLYSETVMLREGYYDQSGTDAEKASRQLVAMKDILWRAARALLDPQIHTGKMTPEEAVDFLAAQLLMDRDRAAAEVNRYVQSPTEVTSYYLGMRQLAQTWADAKAQNPDLTLKQFHDEVLKRALPIPVLAMMRFGVELETLADVRQVLSEEEKKP